MCSVNKRKGEGEKRGSKFIQRTAQYKGEWLIQFRGEMDIIVPLFTTL
jgi:hypothetical protein